jgi:hypothetical protein
MRGFLDHEFMYCSPNPIAERPHAIRGPVERRLGSGFWLLGFVRPVCRFRGKSAKGIFFIISDVLQKKEGAQPFLPALSRKERVTMGGEPHRRSFTFLNRLKLQSDRIFVRSKLQRLKKSKCDVGQDEVVKVEKPIKRTR